MRFVIASCLIGTTVLVLALGAAPGFGQNAPAPSDADPAQPQIGSGPAQDNVSADSKQGDTWRYRRHRGQWWYWLPTNKWVVWNGSAWAAYDPGTYSQFNATRPGQAYSYSNGSQGNWGTTRYNQYGQRQYPYSQRSSGLQQLGPVPAMGGVRSLPGWGGER